MKNFNEEIFISIKVASTVCSRVFVPSECKCHNTNLLLVARILSISKSKCLHSLLCHTML